MYAFRASFSPLNHSDVIFSFYYASRCGVAVFECEEHGFWMEMDRLPSRQEIQDELKISRVTPVELKVETVGSGRDPS